MRSAQTRVLTLFIFAFLILSGCRSDELLRDAPTTDGLIGSSLQIMVASNDFFGDRPRVPILLFDGPDRVTNATAVRASAFRLSAQPPVQVWEGEALNFSDSEVPYWVLYPQVQTPGFYEIRAEITLPDGTIARSEFVIEIQERSSSPTVGAQAPRSENRTLYSEPDITKISSDPDPNPGFYQLTIAEAVASGKPTVVTFSTPAFCTSQLCAPVLASMEEVYAERKDQVNFIHIEIYKDFDTFEVVEEVSEWGLSSEPWTFVIDRSGLIYAKFGGPLSVDELTSSLNVLLR